MQASDQMASFQTEARLPSARPAEVHCAEARPVEVRCAAQTTRALHRHFPRRALRPALIRHVAHSAPRLARASHP